MSDQNPSDPSRKDLPAFSVSRRDFVRRIVGGTGAVLPGMTIIGSIVPGASVKASGVVEVFATDDATLSAQNPVTSYGGTSTLTVASDGLIDLYDAVVQFPLNQIQSGLAAQAGPFSVYLVIWVENVSLFAPGQFINAHPKMGTFNEGSVTWASPDGADLPPTGPGVVPVGGYAFWDVTADATANFSAWRLRLQDSSVPAGATFTSRNSMLPLVLRPMLRIVAAGDEPVPEPSASMAPATPIPSQPALTPAPSSPMVSSPGSTPPPSAPMVSPPPSAPMVSQPAFTPPPTSSAPLPSLSATPSLPTPTPTASRPLLSPTPTASRPLLSPTPTPSRPLPSPTPTMSMALPTPTPTMSMALPTPTPTMSMALPTPTPSPSASRPLPTPTPSPSRTPAPTPTKPPKPSHPPHPSKPPKPSHPPHPSKPPHPGKPKKDKDRHDRDRDDRDRHDRDRRDRDRDDRGRNDKDRNDKDRRR